MPKLLARTLSKDDPGKEVPWLLTCRVSLAIVSCFGFMCLYSMKVNLSVAMVCMVNHTALKMEGDKGQHNGGGGVYNITSNETVTAMINTAGEIEPYEDKCGDGGNSSKKGMEDGEFVWNKEIQGLLLGSFFWGYIITQFPGGMLAGRFGGKRVIGICMFMCAASTVLMPIAAHVHYSFLMVLRFIAGFGQGVVWPAMHAMWAHWAPPDERSKLIGFNFSGAMLGNVITFPIAALLCEYGFAGGWGSIFYVLGGAGLLWCCTWAIFVFDSPHDHPRISVNERNYIEDSLEGAVSKDAHHALNVPWVALVKSPPVWATIMAHTCANFFIYLFMMTLPTYMKEVLHFDIKSNGGLSSLPYLGMWAFTVLTGIIADKLSENETLSITNVRKLFNTCAIGIPAILTIILGFLDCTNSGAAVVVLILAVSFTGCAFSSGFMVNPADFAPKYASIIFGISNTIASFPGFLAPYMAAKLTPNRTREEWQVVFYITAAVCIFGNIFYLIFGSGELQEWAKEEEEAENTIEKLKKKDVEMNSSNENKEAKMREDQRLIADSKT